MEAAAAHPVEVDPPVAVDHDQLTIEGGSGRQDLSRDWPAAGVGGS